MKPFKDHWRQRVSGRFAGDMSFWWGVEEIKEIRYSIGLLCCLLDIVLMMFFGYSFISATLISFMVDIVANVITSFVSMMAQRNYRLKQNAKKGIVQTINRLALNKTRKSNGSETSFENKY